MMRPEGESKRIDTIVRAQASSTCTWSPRLAELSPENRGRFRGAATERRETARQGFRAGPG